MDIVVIQRDQADLNVSTHPFTVHYLLLSLDHVGGSGLQLDMESSMKNGQSCKERRVWQ